MKKEITIGQLLSVASGLIIALATGWITMSNKMSVAERDIRQLQIERDQDKMEYKQYINELKFKMDDLNGNITKILVELQNKQNRR